MRNAPHCREVIPAQTRTRHARCGAFSWCPAMRLVHSRVESRSERPQAGGMAEWSKALVLKTSEVHASVGSNPTPSASNSSDELRWRVGRANRPSPQMTQMDRVPRAISLCLADQSQTLSHRRRPGPGLRVHVGLDPDHGSSSGGLDLGQPTLTLLDHGVYCAIRYLGARVGVSAHGLVLWRMIRFPRVPNKSGTRPINSCGTRTSPPTRRRLSRLAEGATRSIVRHPRPTATKPPPAEQCNKWHPVQGQIRRPSTERMGARLQLRVSWLLPLRIARRAGSLLAWHPFPG